MHHSEISTLVTKALTEDVGSGDITSELTIPSDKKATFELIAKENFLLCGREFFLNSFEKISQDIDINFLYKDGDFIKKGTVIANGSGNAQNILKSERVALNFVQYLSAISTETRKYVDDYFKPYNRERDQSKVKKGK